LGEENTITEAEVFLTVKTLKAGKAAGGEEIRPEMLEAMNRGVLWLIRLSQVAWCSGKVLNPHTQEGRHERIHRGISLYLPWKSVRQVPCKNVLYGI